MQQARARTKVMPGRVTGRIADWKGKFGWIQLDKPVNHPEAKMHRGQVYLSQMDVEAEISGIGASVSFFVYADGTGLGAMNCRPAGSVPVQQTVAKQPQQVPRQVPARAFAQAQPRPAQASAMPAGRKRESTAKIMGQVKLWKGGFGWLVPTEPLQHPLYRGQIYVKASDVLSQQPLQPGQSVSFSLYSDSQGLGADQCSLVDENGAPTAPAAAPAAPAKVVARPLQGRDKAALMAGALGQRERLTEIPTTGEVSDWKGSFGFIRAHEAVDHPQARKREGKIYVAKRDIVGGTELSVGQLVQFHVFVDNSGLGAEECMPF